MITLHTHILDAQRDISLNNFRDDPFTRCPGRNLQASFIRNTLIKKNYKSYRYFQLISLSLSFQFISYSPIYSEVLYIDHQKIAELFCIGTMRCIRLAVYTARFFFVVVSSGHSFWLFNGIISPATIHQQAGSPRTRNQY